MNIQVPTNAVECGEFKTSNGLLKVGRPININTHKIGWGGAFTSNAPPQPTQIAQPATLSPEVFLAQKADKLDAVPYWSVGRTNDSEDVNMQHCVVKVSMRFEAEGSELVAEEFSLPAMKNIKTIQAGVELKVRLGEKSKAVGWSTIEHGEPSNKRQRS